MIPFVPLPRAWKVRPQRRRGGPSAGGLPSPGASFALLAALVLAWSPSRLAAEQIRIVVTRPEIAAPTEPERATARVQSEFLQSLLGFELARSDLFEVIEREDLSRIVQEWEQARVLGAAPPAASPAWLGADAVLLAGGAFTNGQSRLTVRWITVPTGAIEGEWELTVHASHPMPDLTGLVVSLHRQALQLAARREVHTLVSVLDYVCESPFDRNRWLETSLPRRLRIALRRQPGILVLEREEVDALFEEIRLQRAGIATPTPPANKPWSRVQHSCRISGRIRENQPEGQPLQLSLATRVETLADDQALDITQRFPAHALDREIAGLEQRVAEAILRSRGQEEAKVESALDRSREAQRLADLAVRLMQLPDLDSLDFVESFAWEIPPHAFSDAAHPFDTTPQRRTGILRAIRYLKSAGILDPMEPRLKVFLSALLADRSVQDLPLALELAEEVAALHPRFQSRAWRFLAAHTPEPRRGQLRERLIREHPGTWEAKLAITDTLAELVRKFPGPANGTEAIEQARRYMDRSLRWGTCQEADVQQLFRLTQVATGDPDTGPRGRPLRIASVRERGTAVLEDLIRAHPKQAFYLAYYWMLNWSGQEIAPDQTDTWIVRASQAALATDRDPWVIGVRIDPWRTQLARRWMNQGRYPEASELLEPVRNVHEIGTATFLLGQCAFALGDAAGALEKFQTFDADHRDAARFHQDARVWADRCRARLNLLPVPPASSEYASRIGTWDWEEAPFPLPPGTVSALMPDATGLWIGVTHPDFWRPDNAVGLESDPARWAEGLRQGGLVHVDLRSGRVQRFEAGSTLSHPWVMAVVLAADRVWAGTYGKGIDVHDPSTGAWSNHNERTGLPSDYVQCMDADPENLWVGTGRFARGGVARLRIRSGQWQSYLPQDFPEHAPPPIAPVRSLRRVGDHLWCAMEGALYRYDIDANHWTRWPHPQHFTSIAVCSNRVWFGANEFDPPRPTCGLLHCDLSGNDWQTLRQIDGLPEIAIRSLAQAEPHLLLGTYGFMVLNPATKTFLTRNLRTRESRQTYVVSQAVVAHGRLWTARQGENRLYSADWPLAPTPAGSTPP